MFAADAGNPLSQNGRLKAAPYFVSGTHRKFAICVSGSWNPFCRTQSPSTPNRSPTTMSKNRAKSKPTRAKQPSGKGLDGTPCSRLVTLRCRGPALEPLAERCIESQAQDTTGWKKIGYHEIPAEGGGASYNGIRNWRCPVCFAEHRRRVSSANSQLNQPKSH